MSRRRMPEQPEEEDAQGKGGRRGVKGGGAGVSGVVSDDSPMYSATGQLLGHTVPRGDTVIQTVGSMETNGYLHVAHGSWCGWVQTRHLKLPLQPAKVEGVESSPKPEADLAAAEEADRATRSASDEAPRQSMCFRFRAVDIERLEEVCEHMALTSKTAVFRYLLKQQVDAIARSKSPPATASPPTVAKRSK